MDNDDERVFRLSPIYDRAWCPATQMGNWTLVAVPVPSRLKELDEEAYLSLLGVKLQAMFDAEGQPLQYLKQRMWEIGDNLTWEGGVEPDDLGQALVRSPYVMQRLAETGVLAELPVDLSELNPQESQELLYLIQCDPLDEWLGAVSPERLGPDDR